MNASRFVEPVQRLAAEIDALKTALLQEAAAEGPALPADLDAEARQAIQRLVDFFKEIGGQFSVESLDVLLAQARSNFCAPQEDQERRLSTVEPNQARLVVDVKGLSCPMPTLRTIKAIRQIDLGEILQVDSNDPGCRNMLPAWCKRSGHSYLGEREQAGYNSYFIQKC